MKFIEKNNKYIFEKDGVYFALTRDQAIDMLNTLKEIVGRKE